MKHTSRSHVLLPLLLFLLVIILSVRTTRASHLLQQLGRQDVRVDDLPLPGHAAEMEEKYSWELMGLHECKEEDEECLNRRMISEAHMDYIYTQRHKPYKKTYEKGSTSP
ncbi:putative phytosulfokine 6 [Cocos nucifera]|uniref:Phytosulfokine n=1 Tax=Cocos nucifera TaxID=13894 RepID=A0A8K0HZG8_COCNU|nr:putative phytosulfokine 6 [Cocos nucifera]